MRNRSGKNEKRMAGESMTGVATKPRGGARPHQDTPGRSWFRPHFVNHRPMGTFTDRMNLASRSLQIISSKRGDPGEDPTQYSERYAPGVYFPQRRRWCEGLILITT